LADLFGAGFIYPVTLAAGILFTGGVILGLALVLGGAFDILSCSMIGSVCMYFSAVDGLAVGLYYYFRKLIRICSGCFHTVITKLYTCSIFSAYKSPFSNISTIFCLI